MLTPFEIALRFTTLLIVWSITLSILYVILKINTTPITTTTLTSTTNTDIKHKQPRLIPSLFLIASFAFLPYILLSELLQPCYFISAAGAMYAGKTLYLLVIATQKQREDEMWIGKEKDEQPRQQKSFSQFISHFFTMRPDWQLTKTEFDALPSPFTRLKWQGFRMMMFAFIFTFLSKFSWTEIQSSFLFQCLCSYLLGLGGFFFLETFCEWVCLGYYMLFNTYVKPYYPMTPLITCSAAVSTNLHIFWSQRWHQLLKHTLKNVSYYPLQNLLRRMNVNKDLCIALPMISVFILSAIMHQILAYIGMHDTSINQIIFFTLQGVMVAIQLLITNAYPKQVAALPTWLCIAYTHFFLFITSPFFAAPMFHAGWHLIE